MHIFATHRVVGKASCFPFRQVNCTIKEADVYEHGNSRNPGSHARNPRFCVSDTQDAPETPEVETKIPNVLLKKKMQEAAQQKESDCVEVSLGP